MARYSHYQKRIVWVRSNVKGDESYLGFSEQRSHVLLRLPGGSGSLRFLYQSIIQNLIMD